MTFSGAGGIEGRHVPLMASRLMALGSCSSGDVSTSFSARPTAVAALCYRRASALCGVLQPARPHILRRVKTGVCRLGASVPGVGGVKPAFLLRSGEHFSRVTPANPTSSFGKHLLQHATCGQTTVNRSEVK